MLSASTICEDQCWPGGCGGGGGWGVVGTWCNSQDRPLRSVFSMPLDIHSPHRGSPSPWGVPGLGSSGEEAGEALTARPLQSRGESRRRSDSPRPLSQDHTCSPGPGARPLELPKPASPASSGQPWGFAPTGRPGRPARSPFLLPRPLSVPAPAPPRAVEVRGARPPQGTVTGPANSWLSHSIIFPSPGACLQCLQPGL